MEQLLRDVGRGITELEGLYQEESNIDADNAEEIYRRQGEDSQVLDTQLTRAKVALANRRPTNGPAGSNAPQRAGSVESTQSGISSNSTSTKVAYRYQKRTYPVLSKEAGVAEYANFKEEWLEIRDHLGVHEQAQA